MANRNFKWNGITLENCNSNLVWDGHDVNELHWNGAIVWKRNWTLSAPTNFQASDDQCYQVTMTWTNSTDSGNPSCTYDIYKGTLRIAQNVSSGWIYTTAAGAPKASTLYHVKAVNTCTGFSIGDGVSSGADTGSTYWKPSAPTNFQASDDQCNQITMTWTNSTDPGNPSCTYDVYKGAQGASRIAQNVSSGWIYTTAAGAPIVAESYHVKAVNTCTGTSVGDGVSSGTNNGFPYRSPGAPTNFQASDDQCNQVTMTWTAPADTGFGGVLRYDVYQDATRIKVGATSGWIYTTAAGAPKAQTLYHVKATNTCSGTDEGNGTSSGTDNGFPYWGPSKALGLVATDGTRTDGVQCTWNAPTTRGNPTCTYDLYRNNFKILTGVTSGVIDTTAVVSVVYDYKIRATNTCGYQDTLVNTGWKKVAGPTGWTNNSTVGAYGLGVSGLKCRVQSVGSQTGDHFGAWVAYTHGSGFTNRISLSDYGNPPVQYLGFGAGGQGSTGAAQFRQYSPAPGSGWGTGLVTYNTTAFTWSGNSVVGDNQACTNTFATSGGSIRWEDSCPLNTEVGVWTRLE